MAGFQDGFISLMSGMHQGIDPVLLPDGYYAFGLNVSNRKGIARTRPVWKKLDFPNEKFRTMTFQGATRYDHNGQDWLVVSVGGNLVGMNMNNFNIIEWGTALTHTGFIPGMVYFQQAERFLICQDGTSEPVIINWDGTLANSRYAYKMANGDPINEVPIGYSMAYGHGRLFVALKQIGANVVDRKYFAASDIFMANDIPALLGFSETEYLAGGGAFGLPNELGRIRGMEFIRNAPSGSGYGSLIVFAENGASAFAVNQPRADWQDNDISQVLFVDAGTLAHRSILPVNNDIAYRGFDGLRTIGYSAATLGGSSGGLHNEPISTEMEDVFDIDTWINQEFPSIANVNDRLYVTVAGDATTPNIFKAVASLDSTVIASHGAVTPSIFDGIWTGLDFLQILRLEYEDRDRLFAISRNSQGRNELYYLDEDGYQDEGSSQPKCRIYTRVFDFEQPLPFRKRRFKYADVCFSEIVGKLDAKLYYREYGYELWNETDAMSIEANPAGYSQARHKVRFQPHGNPCNPVTKRDAQVGYKFQFCIQWEGKAKIDSARFVVDDMEEYVEISCRLDSGSIKLDAGDAGIVLDDYDYSIV